MRGDDAEGKPRLPPSHDIGCDLAAISVNELRERVDLLQREIARLREEEQRKLASREAAGAVFRI